MSSWPRLERDHTASDEYDEPAEQPPTGSRNSVTRHQTQEPQEEYDVPDNNYELDELAAHFPGSSVLEHRVSQRHSAENRLRSGDGFDGLQDNITELAAPPPLSDANEHPASSKESSLRSGLPIADETNIRPPAPREKVSRFATELYIISYLVFFSILGTLARLGLQALTFYPGAPVQVGVLWANFAGSLVMGFLLEDQNLFREHRRHCVSDRTKRNDVEHNMRQDDTALRQNNAAMQKQASSKQKAATKKTVPLYIGLTTGFCGSFTSFSSFMRDGFLALSNHLPLPVSHISSAPMNTSVVIPRNGGYSFMAICAVIITTIILCLGALRLGAHLAIAIDSLTSKIPRLSARKTVDRMIVFISWTGWLGAVFMAVWPPDRSADLADQAQEVWRGDALFALVFAPPGCLLRFYASLHLNGRSRWFPLGTFAVNMLGTALEGMFFDLQRVPLGGRVGCQALQGMMDGFCGCLTTVSTWVVELNALRVRHTYLYGSISVGFGVGLMVIVMGSFQWTVGFQASLCGH